MPINSIAKEIHHHSANMVLLGWLPKLLASCLPTTSTKAIGRIFAQKGERIVENNYKAFDLGLKG